MMKRKILALLCGISLLSACQGQPPPQIRFGEFGNTDERIQLSNEIAKTLIESALGNEVVAVHTHVSDALDDLLAEKIDFALFIEKPEAQGVPSRCTVVSNEAVVLGKAIGFDDYSKVARCNLATKDKSVFTLIQRLELSLDSLQEALFWKGENNASLHQSALYYLHNNRVGPYGYANWLSEGAVHNMKAVIADEIASSKLPY